MVFEDYQQKESVVVVYTGEGKGKTSAGLGLMIRALGYGQRVAFIQFIKSWETGERKFTRQILPDFEGKLTYFANGKGFFDAGELSAKGVSDDEHRQSAEEAFDFSLRCASSGENDLVVCDEINNAVHDGLLSIDKLSKLLEARHPGTSLCLTGRNFPNELVDRADIVTNMTKVKHHFDDKFLANKGVDY